MTLAFNIRVATLEDIPALMLLAIEGFGEGTREIAIDAFAGLSKDVRCPLFMLVAIQGDAIVGMSSLCQSYFYIDTFCLDWVSVKKEYQGKGIGTELVRESLKFAKTLAKRKHGSVMLVSTDKNLTYYAQFGFKGQTRIHPYLDETSENTVLTYLFEK